GPEAAERLVGLAVDDDGCTLDSQVDDDVLDPALEQPGRLLRAVPVPQHRTVGVDELDLGGRSPEAGPTIEGSLDSSIERRKNPVVLVQDVDQVASGQLDAAVEVAGESCMRAATVYAYPLLGVVAKDSLPGSVAAVVNDDDL